MGTIIFNAIWVGVLSGFLGGLSRLGWLTTVPARNRADTANGPISRLLQQLGLTKAEAQQKVVLAGDQEVPVIVFSVYYLYSVLLAIFFVLGTNINGNLTTGFGTLFGLGLWFLVDGLILPLIRVVPFFWQRSWYELAVELFGYLIFAAVVYFVSLGFPISGVYI